MRWLSISPRGHAFGLIVAESLLEFAYPVLAPFWRFLLGGGCTTAIQYALLIFLADGLGMPYLHAAVLAFIPAFILNFEINRRWTFHRDATSKRELHFTLLLLKNLVLFAVSTPIVNALSVYFAIWYLPVQLGSTAVNTYISFKLTRLIFRL